MGKVIDLTNKKFGRLLVKEYAGKTKFNEALWLCTCECGNTVVVRGTSLRSGNTKSCGCYNKEQVSKSCRVHGMTYTNTYQVWRAIKKRCMNPNDKEFDLYGGRGIRICDEWANNFQAFYDYISKLPHFEEKGYTIDRINNDENYEPNNIRFATYHEQAINRRKRRWHKKPNEEKEV